MRRQPLEPIEQLLRSDLCPPEIDVQCGNLREHYALYLCDEADITDFDYIQQLLIWGGSEYSVCELLDKIKYLVSRGASVRTTSEHGYTALHVTTSVRIAKLLLSLGADINAMSDEGVTPLDYAASTNCMRLAKYLIKNGGKFSYCKRPDLFDL